MAKGKGVVSSSKRPSRHLGDSDDEINKFHFEKERILLGGSDSENYDMSDNDSLEEAVMDLPSESEEDISGGDENVEEKWGRNKKTFYSADFADEDLRDEAREAKKLQKKQLLNLSADDFGNTKKAVKAGVVRMELSDEEEEVSDRFDSENELATLNGDSLDSLLPEKEKLELLSKHSPEVNKFLNEFKSKSLEVKNAIQPILSKLRQNDTEKGLSFLEAKYQLLIGYCANLAYYLILKVKGKGLDNHPVVERLVKYRLLIEKMKPMESKLQYQVDKLLNSASKQGKPSAEEASLSFRPNLEAMTAELSDEEDEDNMANTKYKAPKLAPMHFNNTKSSSDRLEEREKILASRSRLLSDLQAELDEHPEEESIDPVYGNTRKIQKDKNREDYEEDNFVRITLSKKEQKKLERMHSKPIDELEDLNDFFRETDKPQKKIGKGAIEKLLGTKVGSKAKKIGGDDDVPAKRPKNLTIKSTKSDMNADMDSEISEIEDDMGDDDFYKSVKAQRHAKKNHASHKPVSYRPIKDAMGEERPATREMIKNKGLTPLRNKEVRNPRVRQRAKWERAQKKIRSFKPVHKSSSGPYSGEATGIRTDISRSVKF